MQKEQIKFGDWYRMFIGDVPVEYFVELIIRSLFVYLLLMVAMRVMGKRMASRMGRNELVALVTLAATIGLPLTAPERGLLPSVIIAFMVVYISRWIAYKSFVSDKFEALSQGRIDTLVANGVMDLKSMKKVRLTHERLVGQLRQNGIKHLGEVKRFYIEANGGFTLIRNSNPIPGLFIIPRWDDELYDRFKKSDDLMVCENCGTTKQKPFNINTEKCPSCRLVVWTPGVL